MNIEAARSKLPPNLVPELFGPMHEYHTPSILADAIADSPLLPSLAGTTCVVPALEPSAGIGRLVHPFSGKRCSANTSSRPQRTFNLIVSHPPYGKRDADAGPGPGATACKSAHLEGDA